MSTFVWGLLLVLLAVLVAAALFLWTPDRPRAALEADYLNDPADMVEVAGVTLHVRDEGPKTAPTVLMIHGTGSHLQTWDGWAAALMADYRVIRLDLPGAGLSPPDPGGDYSDERTLGILVALQDTLQVSKASLVGNSLGGRIAWKFAAAHPDRTSKLVLVSPDGFASPGFEYGKPPNVPVFMDVMKYALPKSMLRSNLEIAYSDPARLKDETMNRYYELMLAPGARAALLDRMRQSVLVEPEPILATITAPTLLVWGEDDGMIPIANADDYLAAMSNVRLARLPDLGHVPHEEAPEVSIVPVREFLREN